ncbi:MAG: hypothetical protein MH472_04040 [Bacteroidia bacterium]|nr:hypothetical protein [Bacteroidia bacterium]
MDATKCLTDAQWEQYSQQCLSIQEMSLLQSHVGSCEICADIKEGIDTMHDASKLVNRLDSIHEKVDTRVGLKKSKMIPLYFWLSAAAVLVVGIGILFFPMPKEESLAIINHPSPQTQSLPPSDANPEISQEQVLVQPAKVKPKEKTNLKRNVTPTVDNLTEENEVGSVAETIMETKALSEMDDVKPVAETTKTKEFSTSKKSSIILPSNRMLNNQSEFENQVDEVNMVTAVDSSDYKLLVQLIAIERYAKAIEQAEILKKNEFFKEDVYWLLAEIYQKQGNKEARNLALKTLVQLNGKYKEKAERLLAD